MSNTPSGRKAIEIEWGDTSWQKKKTYQPEKELPLGLASPAVRALANAGYTNLRQIASARESQLKKLHGMGPKAIHLLREELAKEGLSFAE